MSRQTVIGLDFGTTNTVLARPTATGDVEALPFRHANETFNAFRSVLAFWQESGDAGRTTHQAAGPWAIERYIAEPHDTRFIQSFKTFAASKAFRDTTVAGRTLTFEHLLAIFFAEFRARAADRLDPLPRRVVLGRPVTFAGLGADPALARARYEAAFRAAGFEEILHVYEPVAAAFWFARRLTRDATVLVADFGGGTSDFSIIRFERTAHGTAAIPLGHSGVAIAGDTFDYRIIDAVVAPRLGKGTRYRSWGKDLDVPAHYYANFARWNQLSILKSPRLLAELRTLARDAHEPDKLEALIAFIDADVGYPLYRAVSDAKMRLSSSDRARLQFAVRGVEIDVDIARADFEGWIGGDLDRIESAVTAVLARAGLAEAGIDRVFLTGGSSFVPAVRRRFETRFGADRIEGGEQLLSIAYGLALVGGLDEASAWTISEEVADVVEGEDA